MCGENGREKVVSKVKSLFERTVENGCTEPEAIAAALAAQRLVAKYGITDAELTDHSSSERMVELMSAQVTAAWSVNLALTVAKAFRCRTYVSRIPRTPRKSYTFIGYETDAAAARLAFEYLYRICARLANKELSRMRRSRPYLSMQGVKKSYCAGFVTGVADELERQTRALMVLVPKEVDDAYESATEGSGSYCPRIGLVDRNLFDTGRFDGRDAARSRGIEGSLGLCG